MINNHQRDLDAHNDSHKFNEDRYRCEPQCQRIPFPLSHDILLTRDLIGGITIPSSISLLVSTLYSFHNTTFHVANSLVTCLQAIPNVHYRVGPEYISPSHGGTNPSLDTCKSTSTFGDTCKTPLQSPSYEVTFEVPKTYSSVPGIDIILWSKKQDT